MMTIIDSSMDMRKLKYTGDPDFDLAAICKVYYVDAIQAEQYEIDRGKDYTLLEIAKAMRTKDSAKLKSIDVFLNSHSPLSGSSNVCTEAEQVAEKMQHTVDLQLIKDDEDHDFAILVLPYCQCGIDIAEIMLHNSQNTELLSMGLSIKKEKTEDIKQLQKRLLETQNLK